METGQEAGWLLLWSSGERVDLNKDSASQESREREREKVPNETFQPMVAT